MTKKPAKARISVTMPQVFIDELEAQVEGGFYLTKGEIVLEALRNHFRERGVKSFLPPEEPR